MSATCFDRLGLQKLCFRTLRKSYLKSKHQEGKKSGKLGSGSLTHAQCAHSNSDVVFLLSQVSHEDENCRKKAEKFTGDSDEKRVFLVVYCVFRGTESTKY